jgi:hypothetical protein
MDQDGAIGGTDQVGKTKKFQHGWKRQSLVSTNPTNPTQNRQVRRWLWQPPKPKLGKKAPMSIMLFQRSLGRW